MFDEVEFEKCLSNNIRVISVDLFDTLLLRNTKSELRRFYEVSLLQSSLLKKHNQDVRPVDLLNARLLAAKVRYQAAARDSKEREVGLGSIFNVVFRLLHITESVKVDDFIRIEINYEKQNLTLNKKLYEFLNIRGNNTRVIAITDMYLSGDCIKELVCFFTEETIDEVYASCDYSLTKRFGGLYNYVCEKEGFPPEDIVHIGDNKFSDYENSIKVGLKAIYLSRGYVFYLKRSIDHRLFVYKLKSWGLNV